jgi:Protein of unknown function (DUF1565)
MLLTSPAFAETVVLDAVLRGPTHAVAPDADYTVPAVFGANVFVFDLSPVSDPILAATLVVVNPPGGFASPQRRETYTLFAVTDASEYADAGEGAPLGAIEVDESSPTALEIPLAAPILRVLERTDGPVAIGGVLTTLKKFDGSERLFAGTGPGTGVPAPQLVLTTDGGATPAAAAILHVDAEADTDTGDGSASAPFASIAFALDLAAPGDVVQVAPGVYEERVWLKSGVELRGSGREDTVIDATELPFGGAVVCAADALLDDFTLRDTAPAPQPGGSFRSSVVECASASEISNNRIEALAASAIALSGTGAWVHHNEIHGALVIATLDSIVEDNEIEAPGTAIDAEPVPGDEDGVAVVRRNRILGAVSTESLHPFICATFGQSPLHLTLASNIFLPPVGPNAEGDGGVELVNCVSGRVLHNTFYATSGVRVDSFESGIANNLLVNGTAGIQADGGVSGEIRHNDVFGNRAGIMGAATNYVGIEDQTGSNGNISEDPDFVDAFLEDFRLRPTSPALDAGSEEEDDIAGTEDFDGDPRVVDGDDDDEDVVDMGAQELQPGEELPLPPLPIEVDLLPGKSPNELKFRKVSKGSGKVAIAIVSNDELDAPAEVDVATLLLDREAVLRCTTKDVDRDDRRDLVCTFPLRGISIEDWPIFVPPACVRGRTLADRKLFGCDEVEIVAP